MLTVDEGLLSVLCIHASSTIIVCKVFMYVCAAACIQSCLHQAHCFPTLQSLSQSKQLLEKRVEELQSELEITAPFRTASKKVCTCEGSANILTVTTTLFVLNWFEETICLVDYNTYCISDNFSDVLDSYQLPSL